MASALTKSRFIAGMHCPALLWYMANAYNQLPQPSPFAQSIMEQGTTVGAFARDAYEGELIEMQGDAACLLTTKAMKEKSVIFEAAFQVQRLQCRVDILEKNGKGWNIIEVKSSTRIKEEHLLDVAFQTYVLQKAGVQVDKQYLVHVNSTYVKKGVVDPKEFFVKSDVTEDVKAHLETIEQQIASLFAAMDGTCPEKETYHTCKGGRDCPLHKFDNLPENNVTELYYTDGVDFVKKGILRIVDIVDGVGLNAKQRVQWETLQTGKTFVDKKALTKWLAALENPITHLDFETINPAIPVFDGTSPYQHMPVQYSVHVETEQLLHREFLGDGRTDPREELLLQLMKDIPQTGTVLAHNMSFEKRVLQELGHAFPQYVSWVKNVIARLQDTIVPFRNFWYYDAKQHGSCSIKYVLPALTEKGYEQLSVGDGATAQLTYARLGTELSEEERKRIRNDLCTYCGLDTEGMVEILRVLREAIQ